MNNIYFIGMPGCGKTTLGKEIALSFSLKFLDLDYYLVEREKKDIPFIFKTRGEKYFRDAETKYLTEVSKDKNLLVATGGGIILKDENILIMKNTGIIIYIDTPVENILKNSDLLNRPLLKDDKKRIYDLYKNRKEKYEKAATYTIKNLNDAQNAINKITDLLNNILYD